MNPPEGVETNFLAPFLYGLFMILTLLILRMIWIYATAGNYLVGRDFDKQKIKPFDKVIIYGSLMVLVISIVRVVIIHSCRIFHLRNRPWAV